MEAKVIGIVLVCIGVIMITYTGINYVTTETLVDIGQLQIESEKNNFVKLSPVIGIVLLMAGIFFLLRRKKSIA